jgi:hypothetical protein
MFDLYALYGLWWEVVNTAEPVVNYECAALISDALAECAIQIGPRLVSAAGRLIYDEACHLGDQSLFPQHCVATWVIEEAPESVRDSFVVCVDDAVIVPDFSTFWRGLGFMDAIKLFKASFWTEHTEIYGGPKWAGITEAVMELFGALKHGATLHELLGRIDRAYHLRHNTGFLFTKNSSMKVGKPQLGCLARVRDVSDFRPLVSPYVRKLFKRVRHREWGRIQTPLLTVLRQSKPPALLAGPPLRGRWRLTVPQHQRS